MENSPLHTRPNVPEDDYVVCTCMDVTHNALVEYIKNGATTMDQLSDLLGIGTGCSSCLPIVEEILEQTHKS